MATSSAPKGHVIAQTEGPGQDAAGNFVQGMNVTAVLDDTGTTFTVFIPLAQYNPDTVRARLEERAAQVAGVHGITFGS